jgi:hypothetical protein
MAGGGVQGCWVQKQQQHQQQQKMEAGRVFDLGRF